jgi:DNA-binding PadR family transcriptional regulator
VSSKTRLLVLGCVKIFQPVHGYDVRRELLSWSAADWANIAPGSIYSALKTLVKDGALEVVGTRTVGGRPERTSFELTPRGEEELNHLLRETWWNVESIIDPLLPGLSFLGFVPRAEAIAALEHRMVTIKALMTQGDSMIAALAGPAGADKPPHVREMLRLSRARVEAELAWAQAFVARLKKGEYVTGSDPAWSPATPPPLAKKGKRVVKAAHEHARSRPRLSPRRRR